VVIVALPSGTRFFSFCKFYSQFTLHYLTPSNFVNGHLLTVWFMIYWSVMAISGADAAVVGRWIWIYWSFKSHCTVIRVDSICQRSCTVTVGCWEFWQRGILLPREGLLFTQAI